MPKRGTIQVATSQFAVSGNIKRNAGQMRRQIERAKRMRADVVHFPETALSGYAGTEFDSWDGFDWDTLRTETESICDLARQRKIWVLLGSSHPLTGRHMPHNCVYVINDHGKIAERYDKRFCTGGDLRFYTPGDHFSVFSINGVKCGVLICYDVRFPELHRAYKELGIQCLFHSFHNTRSVPGPNIWGTIMPPTMQARAATNYFWTSGNNSSAYAQCWPSLFIRPNGEVVQRLRRNEAGVMVNKVDTNTQLYDASAPYRVRSMRGILHSGTVQEDQRSSDRTCL
jgi:predicted amidohydrolase